MTAQLDYTEFVTEEEQATFKRVKGIQMTLGPTAREIAAEMVGGIIGDPKHGSNKQFVITPLGAWRITMNSHTDNTTEVAAHDRMGAKALNFADRDHRRLFWNLHGLYWYEADDDFTSRLRERMSA